MIPDARGYPAGGAINWSSGFLPARHQGVTLRSRGAPIGDLEPAVAMAPEREQATRSLLAEFNRRHLAERGGEEDAIASRIRSYELAARMQLAVPEVAGIERETAATHTLFGLDVPESADFGRGCLLTRRLLERGVRFVQLFFGGSFGSPRINWDGHEDMRENHGREAPRIDRPVAGLLADLRQRGLLGDTLVLFTTEFGRTSFTQSAADVVGTGRDHNQYGFTVWLAGASLKRGTSYGATADIGYMAIDKPTTWHDFHATMLHLLGIDHERLTFYHNGIQRRLTNMHGHVIRDLLARMRMEETSTSSPPSRTPLVGSGEFTYSADAGWCRLPSGQSWLEVVAVATDSRDRVFVFSRSEQPVSVFDSDGTYLFGWGEGEFVRPHGITIGPDDEVYCTDDTDHTVRKYTPEGQLLWTLGTSGQPSNTGATSVDYREIRRAAGPFNYPTNLALAPDGSLYITDGYGNARVHHFSPEGRMLISWGQPGAGPGQFHVPHGVAIDAAGIIYVADRENSRLQRFTPTGEFIDAWTDVARPSEVFIDAAGNVFVAELGFRAGMFPGNQPPTPNPVGGRVSVFSPAGQLLSRWGGGDNPCSPGDFFAPHDIWIDRRGDLYVSEVTYTAGLARGVVGTDCHTLQKFTKLPIG